jgi:hypothetical protein
MQLPYLQRLQEAERAKVVDKLGGWQVAALGELLDAFDMPRPSEGNKEHKIGRLVEFLEKPHKASDKDLAALVRSFGFLYWLHGLLRCVAV